MFPACFMIPNLSPISTIHVSYKKMHNDKRLMIKIISGNAPQIGREARTSFLHIFIFKFVIFD